MKPGPEAFTLQVQIDVLRAKLGELTINYWNSIALSNRKNEWKILIKLRESIFYRIDCISFHLDLLFSIDQQLLDFTKSETATDQEKFGLLKRVSEHQLFFLDDIVFHLISLLDYVGNYVGLLFYGSRKSKLKWKGLIQFCKNQQLELKETGASRIGNTLIQKVILRYQTDLGFRLEEYRASLFHYQKDNVNARISYDLISVDKNDAVVFAPDDLLKWIKQLSVEANADRIPLLNGAFWLIDQTFIALQDAFTALKSDLQV